MQEDSGLEHAVTARPPLGRSAAERPGSAASPEGRINLTTRSGCPRGSRALNYALVSCNATLGDTLRRCLAFTMRGFDIANHSPRANEGEAQERDDD
jgi:hypothetical protein